MMKTELKKFCAVAVSMLLFGGAGCSGEPAKPKMGKVSGRVVFNGEPVEGAIVTFIAPGAPRFASGVTDPDGTFELTTFEKGDGAVVGDCVVTVAKTEAGSGPKNAEDLAKGIPVVPAKQLLPEKYSSVGKSPLKETVTEGVNNIQLELVE
jgi:hypothetical protein